MNGACTEGRMPHDLSYSLRLREEVRRNED